MIDYSCLKSTRCAAQAEYLCVVQEMHQIRAAKCQHSLNICKALQWFHAIDGNGPGILELNRSCGLYNASLAYPPDTNSIKWILNQAFNLLISSLYLALGCFYDSIVFHLYTRFKLTSVQISIAFDPNCHLESVALRSE